MLVLSPESACDICAESYSVESCPHSIPCGHTFCSTCLAKIAQGLWSPRASPACPLCRESFSQADIRLIRVDQAPSPGYPHVHPYPNYFPAASSSAAVSFGAAPIDEDALDHVDDDQRVKLEAKRLEDKISAAAKKKCTFEEISALQREVEQWLAKQLARRPDREHASLRLSAALLGAILVNGFAYSEAKKTAKGVEVSLKDKLDSAEQIKRKLEMELHRQRSQYTQKFFECQQLKQDLSRFTGAQAPSPGTAVVPAAPRPLGVALSTPPRPMTAQPGHSSPLALRTATSTPTGSRSSTPGASPLYASYSHLPKPRPASVFSAVAETTSHLPISASSAAAVYGTTAHFPTAPNSPERGGPAVHHQRWIPPASSRDEEDETQMQARGRQRPASAMGTYAVGGSRLARPSTAVGWRP